MSIVASMSDMLSRVASLGHELVNAWQEDGGVVFFESLGRWTLHSGTVIEIRAASKITIADGKFDDQRIYVDNAPLFEALAREAPRRTPQETRAAPQEPLRSRAVRIFAYESDRKGP